MSRPDPSPASALARGVTATWWYTAASALFFQITTLALWGLDAALRVEAFRGVAPAGFLACALLSVAAVSVLLAEYRRERRAQEADEPWWRTSRWSAIALTVALLSAVALGLLADSVVLIAGLVAFVLGVRPWRPGVRIRLVIALVLLIVAAWVFDASRVSPAEPGLFAVAALFALMLAPATVLSLWWWDIVLALDHARAVESRLAAVQERLRLAGDLHDLQGHHLQVIALQLELAERTMERDPVTAAEHVRAAHRSVDDARRGTRELAARFRGVPLPDELANAADLLRAAGLRVDLEIAADAADASPEILGPIVRECTTNILKHGGGAWARVSLVRHGSMWRLEVANDVRAGVGAPAPGSGLAGIAERVGMVGGHVDTPTAEDVFRVVVTIPGGPPADPPSEVPR
ncbi:histidine kinase [Microbacterium lushaniae]|nr:histidine kinase [Microbacterium lushaniae]KAA9155817.1 histidine kinase [Microbacterium lushaniae]